MVRRTEVLVAMTGVVINVVKMVLIVVHGPYVDALTLWLGEDGIKKVVK